ncbi:unannotated protein [freshwater metagenome]|uniref:Unannotated protein n=1 Tax=freshwater metagenome TaxID=449393 RepID=A0A6J7I324_9ZZZZ|nr:hypothetical protein [Actinomycetota bacterium]
MEATDAHQLGAPDDYFVPASSLQEAIARIFGLTGRSGATRGEKRALIALRDSLGLDVDVVRTNAVLGERLAHSLSIDWEVQRFTDRNKLTLSGVNALLLGAVRAYRSGRLQPPKPVVPPSLTDFQWATFQPASSKLEAVTRIADLTGAPPEHLGPGAKEHRSVLENLADRALPGVPLDRGSKTRLAKSLADHFDVVWTDTCASTGETISLEGLNTILAGAERHLGMLGMREAKIRRDPLREAGMLVGALREGWTSQAWEGRTTVEWLHANNARGANDNEWQGFYFEYRAKQILAETVGPTESSPRVRYGNTTFDYARDFVWDLKAHTTAKVLPRTGRLSAQQKWCMLNAEGAIRECVSEQGLGFVVLSGEAIMDEDGSFVAWHREFKGRDGAISAPSNSGKSRMRKSAFAPLRLDIFWIPDTLSLDEAIAAGVMRVQEQGRQAPRASGQSGNPRAPKFHLDLVGARSTLLADSRMWTSA